MRGVKAVMTRFRRELHAESLRTKKHGGPATIYVLIGATILLLALGRRKR